jgi:hypothetical protein
MASATGREEIIFKIVVSVPSQLEARTIAERSLKGPIIFLTTYLRHLPSNFSSAQAAARARSLVSVWSAC